MDKFRLTECQTLDIPVGNDVPLLVKLVKGFDGCDGEGAVPFPIDVCENVAVTMVSERGQVKSVAHRLGTDGEVLLELQAGDFRAGLTYGIDVRATLNDKAVHAYGKSLVRITAATERGPRQVAQAADPYEVTLQVGYVGDLIPRRLDELEGYDELMAEVGGKADAEEVGEALAAVGREFQKYIPLAHKAVAGGVASLNGEKKVPTDQLQFPLRGQLNPSQIDSTTLADGVYQVNGKVLSPDILGGAQANGVLVQYPWDSRVQTLFVGRAAAHADGEQVEIYTRRYLPTPKRWTAWMRIDGGGGGGTSDDIYVVHIRPNGSTFTLVEPVQEVFAARDAGKTIIGIVEGVRMGGVLNYLRGNDGGLVISLACANKVDASEMRYDVYYIFDGQDVVEKNSITLNLGKMTANEAEAGTAQVARTISASVLKAAIRKHAPAPDLSSYALKSDTLDRYKVGEEVLIGEWEENGVAYDLYRKVVSFGELPNAGQKTVAHGISNKVKFVGVSAMASNGFPIPFVTQDIGKAIYLALDSNQITINTHATDRSSLTADVTILFTRNKP